MIKFFAIFLILFLILMTAIIKNSTKRIDDEIFTFEENIRDLNKNFGKIKLEHEYLSSAEKLIKFQELYFDDQLMKKNLKEIKIINQKLEIKNLD